MWFVRGRRLTVAERPAPLLPLMRKYVAIKFEAKRIEGEDDEAAITLAQQCRAVPVQRLERARKLWECGAGYDVREGDREKDMSGLRREEGCGIAFCE